MKKIIAGMLMFSCIASIHAAQVSFLSGSTSTPYTNEVNDFEINSEEYDQRETNFALVSPESNNGEELIYLGAYQNMGFSLEESVKTISVDVKNVTETQTNTGGVSLVLSGGREMIWDVTWDTSVALNSIVLFGLAGNQSLIINGTPIDLSDMSSSVLGLDIKHSETNICGYALPQDTTDCRTDRMLGINQITNNLVGMQVSSNSANIDYLANETGLKVTSFNGAYEANSFVVGIDTTAVPLPGAFFLFSSTLYLVFASKKVKSNRVQC